MARPKLTEAQLHRQVADYLAAALPVKGCVWTTFPAGGGGRVRGAKLKAAGLRPGWPDVQILWRPRRIFMGTDHGCLIGLELKTRTGKLSPDQIECHAAIRDAGGYVSICRSVDEVALSLRGWGIPLRATLNPGGGWRKAA